MMSLYLFLLYFYFIGIDCQNSRPDQNLWIWPTAFEDDGKPFAEFTCNAYLKAGQWLTWYQTSPVEFKTTIQAANYGYITMNLLLPLDESADGKEIYCRTDEQQSRYWTKISESHKIKIDLHKRGMLLPRPDQNLWIWPTAFEDDGKPFAEFTCNAYLKAGQWLTWYQTSPVEFKTTIQAANYGYITMNLLLPLDESADGKEIYCRTDEQQSRYWTKISESHKIKIDLHKRGMLLRKTEDPRVTPETFVDNGDPFVEFTCWARLERNHLLSWYQVNPGQLETTKRITSTQQDNHYGFVKILLQMKLEESDNNTIIYCAKETVTETGILTDQKPSEKISIVFHRSTELWGNEHPWVTPETFKDDGQSVMEFTCHAYLNNADLLSWFQITGSNIPKRLSVIQQTYGSGYNKTKLMKVLEPSDNGTQIYCARKTLTAFKRSEFRSPIIPILFQRETPYITVQPRNDVIIFDNEIELDLICSGSKPVNNRRYTWHMKDATWEWIPSQVYDKHTNQNRLQLKLAYGTSYHMKQLYCAQDFTLKILASNYLKLTYGELVRSQMITLLHHTTGDKELKPMVTPEKLEDTGNPFIEFTCFAFLQKGDVLYWYQETDSEFGPPVKVSLRMKQHQEDEEQWVTLTLNKTKENTDNNSNIYCAKQTVRSDGSLSEKSWSQNILITFNKFNQPLESLVIVEPNTSIIDYRLNAKVNFTCTGIQQLEEGNYTWFRKEPDSLITILPNQVYDTKTNKNTLVLYLDESYNQNEIFCAQEFFYKYHYYSSVYAKETFKYSGKLARSNVITFMLQKQDDDDLPTTISITVRKSEEEHVPDKILITALAVTLSLSIALLVVAAGAIYTLRKQRHFPTQSVNVNNEVIYAVLDLPNNKNAEETYQNANDIQNAQASVDKQTTKPTESEPYYAEVVGVLQQFKK